MLKVFLRNIFFLLISFLSISSKLLLMSLSMYTIPYLRIYISCFFFHSNIDGTFKSNISNFNSNEWVKRFFFSLNELIGFIKYAKLHTNTQIHCSIIYIKSILNIMFLTISIRYEMEKYENGIIAVQKRSSKHEQRKNSCRFFYSSSCLINFSMRFLS